MANGNIFPLSIRTHTHIYTSVCYCVCIEKQHYDRSIVAHRLFMNIYFMRVGTSIKSLLPPFV